MNPLDEFLEMKKEGSWRENVSKALMERVLPTVGVAAGIGAGFAGAEKAIGSIKERFGKQRDFKAMMDANPHLGKMDAGNVQLVYNSMRKAAPALASDPLLAGSFVRKTLEMSDPPYVDPQTTKMLTDAQKNISQSRGGGMRDVMMGAAIRGMSGGS
jgi:hypothetical protein